MGLGKEGLWPVQTVYTGPVMANTATLRDYFAGQTLAGLAAICGTDTAAKSAYDYADAMLRERDKEWR